MVSVLLQWILEPWHRRCRRLDAELLWPAILRGATDLDHAYRAFAEHAIRDEHWRYLSVEEMKNEMAKLPTGILS